MTLWFKLRKQRLGLLQVGQGKPCAETVLWCVDPGVEAQIVPANWGAQRVLAKLGFGYEGYLRENYSCAAQQRFDDTAGHGLLHAE